MPALVSKIKDRAALVLKSFAGQRLRFLHALGGPFSQRPVIAVFHRVSDAVPPDGMTMGTAAFREYCAYFRRNFQVISLTGLLDRLEQGRDASNTLVITFDDGYRDNLTQAAPILESLNLPACFFVTTDFIGKDTVPFWDKDSPAPHPYMSWDEVRELRARGFEVGSHTRTHANLGEIQGEAAREEIFGSKAELERELGTTVDLFAYPFGHERFLSEDNRRLVREAGYRCCLGYGPPPGPGADPFRLGRLPLSAWYASPEHYGGHSMLLSLKAGLRGEGRCSPAGGRPKVLHVIDALNVGGAQELVALLAKHQGRRFDMSVAVIQPVLDLKERIESYGVTVHALNRERVSIRDPLGFASYALGSIRDIIRIGRAEGAGILQSHLSDAEFLCFFASFSRVFTRFCTTVHTPKLLPEHREGGLRNLARLLLTRLLCLKADKVVSVSGQTTQNLKEFAKVSEPKLVTVANGVEALEIAARQSALSRQDLGLAPTDRILLTVGRLTNAKGHVHLLHAMARLGDSMPGLRLLVAGDGELRDELRGLHARLDLDGRVRFLGARADVPDLLTLADAYVSSSVFEGTSLAVMEAMAAGLPIVATAIDGNRELLTHAENAWLVTPADPDALAEGIAKVCSDAELAARLGQAAQKRCIEEYDIRQVVRKYEAVWSGEGGSSTA